MASLELRARLGWVNLTLKNCQPDSMKKWQSLIIDEPVSGEVISIIREQKTFPTGSQTWNSISPPTWINFRAHTFANAFNWHMKIDAQAWAVPPCGVPAQDFNRKNQSWAYLCIYLLTDIWNWRSGLSRAVMSLARWRSACLRLSTKLSSFWRWLN